ncbi:receptor expression-enhancing protein 4-like isoform X1 [Orbicella faveolata]|uniref:receptor expression-enhancing protein 4-like isoform X1 n=1 Tax=Orbicella faveolata TaxID=48498 RepID=UPI0009E39BBE|nr:receptor expression-enhancing protein 4-like isoform X1 [Orbicella faveolata]
MVSYVASRVIMLVFGTLYPAYSSYKAIKTKNVREYVRWMMYWIVFALFITLELFADLLLAFWFPFYYEIKIMFMLWLLLPATKGSSILYRKFVHPWLSRNEKDIDSYIAQLKESGYDTFLRVSKNSLSIAADTMIKTATTGQTVLAEKLRHYGTDATDNKPARLHKARSWYGGMNAIDNDYSPIDESEEFNLIEEREEEEEEFVNPDAESAKLRDELRENPEESKSRVSKQSSTSQGSSRYKSSTLPRSHGKTSTRPRVHGSGYDHFESTSASYYSGSSTRTYETSTLPRQYEHVNTRVQPRRSQRNKKARSLPVIPNVLNEEQC